MFSLNGEAGKQYGIPYLIQTRSSFGMRGSKIVEILRALPAIAWYGIGTWIAALSLDGILTTLTGFTAPWTKYVYFVALQVVQTVLAYGGIRTMKWFNVYGSLVIAAVMLYMLVHIVSTHGFQIEETWRRAGGLGPAILGRVDGRHRHPRDRDAEHQRHDASPDELAARELARALLGVRAAVVLHADARHRRRRLARHLGSGRRR